MSIEALRWALDIGEERQLQPARRLVLIVLGNSADHRGASLFPSIGWVCKRTGMGISTVRAHIAGLESEGLLTRDERVRPDGGRTSNSMQLSMPQAGLDLEAHDEWGIKTPPPKSGGGVQKLAGGPPASRRGGGGLHTKVLKQEVNKGFQPPDWIPKDSWTGYEAMRAKIRKPMTDRARELTVKKLALLKTQGHEPGPVLDQSVECSWTTVYPLKAQGTNGNTPTDGWWSTPDSILKEAKRLGIYTVGATAQVLKSKINEKLAREH